MLRKITERLYREAITIFIILMKNNIQNKCFLKQGTVALNFHLFPLHLFHLCHSLIGKADHRLDFSSKNEKESVYINHSDSVSSVKNYFRDGTGIQSWPIKKFQGMTAKWKQGTYSSRGQCGRPATTGEVSTVTFRSGEGKSSVTRKRQLCPYWARPETLCLSISSWRSQ